MNVTAYFVYCRKSTRGPFATREDAEQAREMYLQRGLLGEKSLYGIDWVVIEQLPDGRLIADDRVLPGFVPPDKALSTDAIFLDY